MEVGQIHSIEYRREWIGKEPDSRLLYSFIPMSLTKYLKENAKFNRKLY